MKFAPCRRRSIRYSIFIGVLAGSVFSGSGAFATVIEINTQGELEIIGDDLTTRAGNYILMSDLSLNPPLSGASTYIAGTFTGTLNGNGKTLSGLTKPLFDIVSGDVIDLNLATAPLDQGVGGVIGSGALANTLGLDGTVDNVDVTGRVQGGLSVGGLVGTSSGSISGSTVNSDVYGNEEVGGLVGRLESGATITDSHATSNEFGSGVSGLVTVGGLVGYSQGSITTSTASGPVSGVGFIEDSENQNIGGLVGVLHVGATITNSNASGYVYGGLNVGGLVGLSSGVITDSHATGGVEGESNIGGLVGYSDTDGEITDSHATGYVEGESNIGGLVGWSDSNIADSHATGDVEGESNIGGLVGYSYYDGHITDSHATGDVTGQGDYIGGLVGEAYGDITGSWHTTGTVTGYQYVGGLVGWSDNDITDSYATGDVFGVLDVGGLVGWSDSNITDSHATGDVDGEENVGGLVGFSENDITNSYATGIVTGDNDTGGLVGYSEGDITNSYATGNVIGDVDTGGLVGDSEGDITNSYATGDVTGSFEGDGDDAGGLVGYSDGDITNSYATGDVSGVADVGGLVGDLDGGSIRNSYATGNVRATGTNGNWDNGWGGLVGESSGVISNSYATGNVVADYNYGSLIGFLMLDLYLDPQIENSFATGSNSSATNGVQLYEDIYDENNDFVGDVPISELNGLGGFVGCTSTGNDFSGSYSCLNSYKSFPVTTPSILSVVNTVNGLDEPAFEIVECKNNGLPLLTILIDSYANTCTSHPSAVSVSAVLASVVQLNPKFNLLESTTLRLFLYLAGDDSIRITVEDFVVLGVTGVNKTNLPVLLRLLKNVDLFTLDLKTINKNVKIADELLKKKKKK
jgi:hypothetical protein